MADDRIRKARPDTDPTPERVGAEGGVPGDGASGNGVPTPSEPAVEATAPAPPRRRRWARRLAFTALALVALVAVLVLGALVFLRSEFGRGRIQSVAVAQIQNLLAEGATVEVARLDGNFLTGARMVGLVIRQDGEPTVTIDTVLVEYNLRTLLRRTFSADELYVGGPTVYVRQRADSTFNVAGLLKPAEPTTDSTGANFRVVMDEVGLRRGRVEVRFYNPDRDSVLVLDELALRARDVYSGPDSLRATLDTLSTSIIAPDDAARLQLAASGTFSREEALDLRALTVTSDAGTRVSGRARYRLDAENVFGAVEANLALAPLALADVRALTGLELYGEPRVRLVARPAGEALSLSLNGALGDASIVLDGALDRDGDGPLRYRLEGQLRDFDPAVVTRNPALAADLNADLEVDLVGTDPRTLDGPFSLSLVDSRVAGRPIERLQVDGAFRTGRIDFDLEAAVPGARLVAEGVARPFDPVPTYDVQGTAEEVDLARLTGDPTRRVRFSGDFAVGGSGKSADDAQVEAVVALDAAQINDLTLDYADATATLRDGRLQFVAETAVAGGGGRIEATGEARPFDDPVAYRVTDGRVTDFNVAAVTGNEAQASRLTGRFALDGKGVDPQALDLEARLELEPSTFGTYSVETLALTADLDGGRLGFDARADLGRVGRFQAEGTARPFDETISYDATGRVENLDLAALTNDPARQSDLTAGFDVEGRGTDLATLSLDARLDLDPSSYGAQEVSDGTVNLALRGGRFEANGTVRTPEGAFDLVADGRPFDPTPAFALRNGTRFEGLDLGRVTGNPDLRTDLSGEIVADVVGLDPATMRAEGRLTLGPSSVGETTVRGGTADFTLAEGLVTTTAAVDLARALPIDLDRDGKPDVDASGEATPASRLDLAFTGRPFDETPTYDAEGTLTAVDPSAFVGPGSDERGPTRITAAFEVSGAGLGLETATARGRVSASPSVVFGVRVDTLALPFALDRGALTLDTLLLRSDVADATGGGRIVLSEPDSARGDLGATRFALEAELKDPAPLEALAGRPLALADGNVTASVEGEPGEPLMIDVQAVGERLAVGTTAVNEFDARLTGTFDPATTALDVRTRVAFDFLATPRLLVERGDFDVTYDGDSLTADGRVRLDEGRDLDFLVRADLQSEPPNVLVERAQFNLDGQRWALGGPARVTFADGEYRLQNLLIASEDGQQLLAADGVIDRAGEQQFILTAENVQFGPLADLAGFKGLDGRLSATLELEGPAEDPVIEGTLDLADFTSRGEEVGTADIGVAYDDGRLNLDARLTNPTGQSLTARGYLPLQFSLAPALGDSTAGPAVEEAASGGEGVRFVVRADSFPIGFVEPFLVEMGYSEVAGTLTIPDSVTVTGTQAAPQLAGRATLTDGRLGVVATGRVYQTITAPLLFEGDRIVLDGTRIDGPDGGSLAVDGTITLRELSVGELDLTLTPAEFTATDTPTYRELVLDRGAEPLRLTGTLEQPQLRGAVVLAEGDIYLTDELVAPEFEQVELTAEDIQTIQARFGRRVTRRDTAATPFVDRLDYDLTVAIRQDVWLRAESGLPFDIEFAGDVRATKRPFADTTNLFGQIELTRGTVETLNRRFEIERGSRLTFNGPPTDALADVRATLEVRLDNLAQGGVEIQMAFQGRVSQNPEIRLTSTPQLDNADIVSLIATGQLASELVGGGALGGGGGLGGVASGVALGQLSSIVEGVAGEALGLDVVQVDASANGEVVIRLGRYLTDRAFFSVGAPITGGQSGRRGTSSTEVTLEYALKRWLQLQLEYQEAQGSSPGAGGGLVYQLAY